jgi:hypothetical protein
MGIEWVEVSKNNPCPICGHISWCSMSSDRDHVCCRRGDGGGFEKVDKSGGIYWYYYLGEESPDRRVDDEILPPDRSDSKRTDPDTLNQVYSSLLNELTLSSEHRENLKGRELPDDEINRYGYKSLQLQGRSKLAKTLKSKFGTDTLLHVPGFYKKEERGKSWITMAGSPGILIPVRDYQGRIIGLKIRVDSPKEPDQKYIWLSSAGRPGGTGQVNLLHVPLFNGDKPKILRLTEGELKADIATALSGILTLSLPGVNSWRLALSAIKEFRAEKVIVAFDADAHNNRNVANHLLNLFIELLKLDNGLSLKSVYLEIWDTSFKGIDDVLAAGKDTQTIEGEAALGIIQGMVNEATALNPIKDLPKAPMVIDELGDNYPEEVKNHKRSQYYQIDHKTGVFQNTEKGFVHVCPVPLVITRYYNNVDTGQQKVEIAFYRNFNWNRVSGNNSQVFHNQNIISLADYGLPVTGANSREIVKYLTDYQGRNIDLIQTALSVSRFGWIDIDGKSYFAPYELNDIVIDTDIDFSGYRSVGDFEKWKTMALKLRQEYPLVRLSISAAFASPLLKLLNHRSFIIHFWGPTRKGKTAMTKASLSVWGDPEALLVNFNSTKVALEKIAGFFSDLPIGIDERQVVGDKQEFIESIVYLLGLGKGRARGSKTGGLQHISTWRSIFLTNGEHPLSADESAGGVKTRAIEIYGRPIEDEQFARKIHAFFSQHFGHAGPLFIKKLLNIDRAWLSHTYETLIDNLNQKYGNKIGAHLTALACIAIADLLASQWIFGLSDTIAADESIKMIDVIFNELENAVAADDAVRAYEYLKSFFLQNPERFKESFSNLPRLGFFDANCIYFYPNALVEIMKDGGFNITRVINDWRISGWIITEHRSGEKWPRTKIRKADPYNKGEMAQFYAIKRNIEIAA